MEKLNKENSMKPCPFCGMQPDTEDVDTIYPNGIGWADTERGYRKYVHFHDVPKDQWCYTMHCPTTAGGCGVEISGDSREEAIDKWNRRALIPDQQTANDRCIFP